MAGDPQKMKKVEKKITVQNKLGFHARAAANFVKTAEKFQSEVMVIKDDVEANGKSILGLLTLGAGKGSIIKIIIEGPDADRAIEALEKLVNNKFGEEE